MYTKVKDHIVTNQLIQPGEKLLLAVSGGADSMAMLDVFSRLSTELAFLFMVVTVDHMLRGTASEADRLFVENYCHIRAIPVVGKSVDVKSFKQTHGAGTQVAARTLRYQAFQHVMSQHDCDTLVLAHHADDQVESLIMALVKSTDPRQLTGMPEARGFGDKRLIRPFIHVAKADIYDYVQKWQIPYREDPSNADDHYRRNAVRHHVIPRLKQFNPELLKTTDVLMAHLKEDNDYLMKEAEKRFDEWVEKRQDNQEVSIDISIVKKEARALQRRLFHLILNYLYDTLPSRLSYKHETAFFSLLQHTDGQRSVDLPDGLVMRQVYDRLMFCFKDQHTCETTVNDTTSASHKRPLSFEETIVEEKKDATKDCLYLPYALYHQGMYHVRTRKAGDKIYLPELDGHKKVSRIFIDQKIPQDQRDHWPLLVDEHDHVVWVMGLTKPFIQTHVEAKQYVKLTYQKNHIKICRRNMMHNDIEKILVTKEEIDQKCEELGKALSEEYRDRFPLAVGVLKGALPFMSDILRHMDTYLEMDFMDVSSYGSGMKSSGEVKIEKDLNTKVEGRDILIIEDIIDSGLTLSYLVDLFKYRKAKSIKIVTLLDKPEGRTANITADVVGFKVPNEFVVGYGLDYQEKYRNLPYIGVLKPHIYGGDQAE